METAFIAGIIIVPAIIILGGYFILNRGAPESNTIKDVLIAELKRIEAMRPEEAQAFCKKEPAVEIMANKVKFIRILSCDKYGATQLVIRVTIQGIINKQLEESKVITKELND